MPHQCTSCDHVFADGSKEMLSGCPDCGGNTFQYLPDEADAVPEESPPERPGTDSTVAKTVGRAATTLRDAVSSAAGGSGDSTSDAGFDAEPPASTPADGPTEASTAETPSPTGTGTADSETVAASAPDTAASDDASDYSDDASDYSDPLPAEEDPRRDAEFIDADETPPGDGDSSPDEPSEPDGDTRADESAAKDADTPAEEPLDADGAAQSSARSDVVSRDELPDGMAGFGSAPPDDADSPTAEQPDARTDRADQGAAGPAPEAHGDAAGSDPPADGRVVDTPSEERPDLSELREELNDQFEGIRIVERGQYELNLMELYERDETIIALKENGRYVIEPPESWRGET